MLAAWSAMKATAATRFLPTISKASGSTSRTTSSLIRSGPIWLPILFTKGLRVHGASTVPIKSWITIPSIAWTRARRRLRDNRVTFDTTRPNGLLFSLDYKTLYVAQSGREKSEYRQLRAYPVKPDKTLGAPEVLHDFGEHRGIDGMRLDTEGNIVATAGWEIGGPGPMIYVFSPSGEVLRPIRSRVPAPPIARSAARI